MSRSVRQCDIHTTLMAMLWLSLFFLQGIVSEVDSFVTKDETSTTPYVTSHEKTLSLQDYSASDLHKTCERNSTSCNSRSGLVTTMKSVYKREAEDTSELPDMGRFPFIVAVYRKDGGETLVCAGAIFSDRLVLTSGLCVGNKPEQHEPNKYTILAGINDLSISTDKHAQWRTVVKMAFDNDNDPALVMMTTGTPFKFTWQVGPKRIPFETFTGWRKCTAIAWAQSDSSTRKEKGRLVASTMFVVDSNTCSMLYPLASPTLPRNSVCAEQYDVKKKDAGICMGDDGTVLFCGDVITGFVRRPSGWSCDGNFDEPSTWVDVGALSRWTAEVIRRAM